MIITSKDLKYFKICVRHLPWGNEVDDLLQNDNENSCFTHKSAIEEIRLQFELIKEEELDEILLQDKLEHNDIVDNTIASYVLDDE